MVEHPRLLLNKCGTAAPTSAQAIEVPPSSLLLLSPLVGCPKSLSRVETKSETVIPSLFSAWMEVRTALVRSNKISASATCSRGLCTEKSSKNTRLKELNEGQKRKIAIQHPTIV